MTAPAEPWMIEIATNEDLKPGGTTYRTISFPFVGNIVRNINLAARRSMASLHRMWINYYQHEAFGEEGFVMPGSAFRFIVGGLLSFVEIKSQGQAEFPFKTHPQAIKFAITSLLMYGLTSGAEQLISAASPGPTSVYAIIARQSKNQGAKDSEIFTTTTTSSPCACDCLCDPLQNPLQSTKILHQTAHFCYVWYSIDGLGVRLEWKIRLPLLFSSNLIFYSKHTPRPQECHY